MADITYCGHHECPSKECMRHYTHVPAGRDVSWAMFDCPYIPLDYFDGYEEMIHAHWIPVECGTMCSACKRVFDKDFEIRRNVCRELKRCPDCGAHMDEEVDE